MYANSTRTVREHRRKLVRGLFADCSRNNEFEKSDPFENFDLHSDRRDVEIDALGR